MQKALRSGGFFRDRVMPLVYQVITDFQRHNVVLLSAALAYFALFSLFPLLLIILSLVGFLIGDEDSLVRRILQAIMGDTDGNGALDQIGGDISVDDQIFAFVAQAISPDVAQLIDETLKTLNAGSVEAGLTGILVLFWVASTIFGQLEWAFRIIWGVQNNQPVTPGWRTAVLGFLQRRVLAVLLVMISAAALMVSVVAQTVLTLIREALPTILQDFGWDTIYFTAGFLLLFVMLLLLFKYLPRPRVTWGDVWHGALITTILISLLVNLSSWFIGSRNFLSYGVVGSIMALLFWIYLTSMAIYLGAEFTQVYTYMYGSLREEANGYSDA